MHVSSFIVDSFENTFIGPNYWQNLDKNTQENIIERFLETSKPEIYNKILEHYGDFNPRLPRINVFEDVGVRDIRRINF